MPAVGASAAALAVATRALADTPAKTKSSGSGGVLLIVIIVVALLFLVLNARRRSRVVQSQQQEIVVGARVMTRSGLIATLVDRSDDEVVLEIAPGVRARFDGRAIARALPDETGSNPDGPGSQHADDPDGPGDGRLAD